MKCCSCHQIEFFCHIERTTSRKKTRIKSRTFAYCSCLLPTDIFKISPIFEPYPSIVSKKQIRISEPQEIKNRMPEFLNKNVSLVLKDNTVIFGTLREAKNGKVALSNMRGRKMTFLMDDISEIYTDLDS